MSSVPVQWEWEIISIHWAELPFWWEAGHWAALEFWDIGQRSEEAHSPAKTSRAEQQRVHPDSSWERSKNSSVVSGEKGMRFEGRQIWVKIYFYPLLVCDYGKPDKLTQVLLALPPNRAAKTRIKSCMCSKCGSSWSPSFFPSKK